MPAEVVIDAPPITPPPNGLLNAATVIDRDDPYWVNGLRFARENCDDAVAFDPCASEFSFSDTTRNRPGTGTALPFAIEAFDTCSTFGYERADYEGRARRAMAARETKAVEHELATGTIMPGNTHLQDAVLTVALNGGTAVGPRTALALLVQAIADHNLGTGMIHARPGLVTVWSALNALRWQNGKLYTLNGNLVVPGAGYPGAAPDGTAAAAASEWAYVTDPLQVQRGPVEVFVPGADSAAVDRTNNTITVRAQRIYAVVGNFCGVYAVNVNPTLA